MFSPSALNFVEDHAACGHVNKEINQSLILNCFMSESAIFYTVWSQTSTGKN